MFPNVTNQHLGLPCKTFSYKQQISKGRLVDIIELEADGKIRS